MSLISNFRDALTVEIEEQKRKGTARWDVRAGRLIEIRGPLYVYSFILDDPTLAGAFDDTPVQVRTAQSDASGHIVGVSGSQVYVAIESDLGQYIPSAHILAQPYYLLELLSERLSSLQESSCVISNKCLRIEAFRYQKDDVFLPEEHIRSQWDQLNAEQEAAVRQALGSEVCYIWGPPGTGKTTTVGVAIAGMIQKGSTILLTANTNVAVDQALETCLKSLVQTDHYEDGRILRLGTPQIKEISQDDNLNLDKITERKSIPLKEELTKLQDELANAKRRLAKLESLKKSLERWGELSTQIEQTRSLHDEIEAFLSTLARRSSTLNESVKKEQRRYERARAMPALMRVLRGMTLTRIQNSLSNLAAEHNTIVEKRVQAEAGLKEACDNLDSLEKEAGDIQHVLKEAHTSTDALGSEIRATQAMVDSLSIKVTDLEKRIEAIRQEVISKAVLVATTLARTHTMTEVYGRQYNVLVCDEASMAPIPAVYWACSLATESVTVAGDFRQLAPIALSDDPRVKEWLRRDVFVAASMNRQWQLDEVKESPMVMLKTQYRMQPDIRALVSKVFYGGQLRDGIVEDPKIRDSQPCPGVYVGIYDTSTIDPWCSWTSSYSRFNLYHAVLDVTLCQTAIHDYENIGIITPYKAQTRLIKVLVDMHPTLKEKVIVSNVHRFQGRERDLIICDLVDSTGLRIGKLLRGRIDSEDIDDSEGARLVNVAFSRAKKKLAIVANLSYLRSRLNETWSIQQVLFGKTDPLGTFSAEQLVPGYADPAIRKARTIVQPPVKVDSAVSSLWTEEKSHSGIYNDLEKASRYAIIMSPFITQQRLKTYVDLFRAIIDRGIHVQVITRPSYQQGLLDKNEVEKMLGYLEKIGINVIQRSSMHQKVIVVDGRIVWFGSLNALSHKNTQELMFRLESESFTKQVMDECGLQTLDQKTETLASAVDVTKIPQRLCSRCGHPMTVIPKGRYGPFYKCKRDGSTANVRREDLELAMLPEAKICPECGREMEIRWSKTGVFLGCTGYRDREKQCRHTRSL